jgi:hypothetical protein
MKSPPLLICAAVLIGSIIFAFLAPPPPQPAPSSTPTLAERASLQLSRESSSCSCTMNDALANAILSNP